MFNFIIITKKFFILVFLMMMCFDTFQAEPMTKIVVIGGFEADAEYGGTNVEIIDISDEKSKNCPTLPDYRDIYQLSASYLNGKILACGGMYYSSYDTFFCYELGRQNLKEWVHTMSLPSSEHLMVTPTDCN